MPGQSRSTRQPKGPSQRQLDLERDWNGRIFKSTGTTTPPLKKVKRKPKKKTRTA